MEDVLKELSLYDLTAYLLPGVVAVWSVMAAHEALRRRRNSPHIELTVWAFVAAAYLSGHLVQAIASRFYRLFPRSSVNSLYTAEPQLKDALTAQIASRFGNPPDEKRLDLCQTYLQIRGIDGQVATMQARHAFFRGLTLAFMMAFAAFVFKAGVEHQRHSPRDQLTAERQRNSLLLAAIVLVAAIISVVRLVEFDRYYVDSVFRSFYEECLREEHIPVVSGTASRDVAAAPGS